ncbi:MAG: response regulator [Candidatus Omnitrophica bacterium]|nr:response regulator [Candidatus Omnitrophota bacterium]
MGRDKEGKARIVIVDDNSDIRDTVESMLSDKGYEIKALASACELYAHLKEKGVDLIILDLVMPEKDGLEVISSIKAAYPEIKIVVYTGHEQYEYSAYSRKADKFVLKGSDSGRLIKAVEEALKQKK